MRRVLPGWVAGYRREWLRPDVVAGLVVGSVVVPQCVAYAQIAGLPPQAGLMAAPPALIGYALLGSSRSLVVSATTATSVISAAAVGPLAHGDTGRFAVLSAALALVAGVVLFLGGLLRLGVVSEFVSKPVMTGFMFGIGLLSTEAAGVARSMAVEHHYRIDANRELSAIGAGNVLAGLCSGFVQSGGASQSAAADKAGGQSQLATLVAAALILLTGAFLAPVFTDLPEATLAAIVIVAVAGFVRVDELHRLARLRRSAIVLALLCLAGVLLFGVLPGLVITAGLSLVVVIQRLSRPRVTTRAEDGRVTVQPQGPLFYANSNAVRDRALAAVRAASAHTLVLDLAQSTDLDVETLDMLAGLRDEVDLRLASVHPRPLEMLRRAGLAELAAEPAPVA